MQAYISRCVSLRPDQIDWIERRTRHAREFSRELRTLLDALIRRERGGGEEREAREEEVERCG